MTVTSPILSYINLLPLTRIIIINKKKEINSTNIFMTILYYKFRKNRSTFFLAIRAYTFNSIKYSFFNHFPLLILIILLFSSQYLHQRSNLIQLRTSKLRKLLIYNYHAKEFLDSKKE